MNDFNLGKNRSNWIKNDKFKHGNVHTLAQIERERKQKIKL